MKATLNFLAPLLLLIYLYSCTQPVSQKENKSQRFIGTWADSENVNIEYPNIIRIERNEDKFLIYPDHFYMWDGITGLTGQTLSATYDEQNDKLLVSFGTITNELIYNSSDNTLINGTRKLVPFNKKQ
jgi:hypothetical protein